MCSMERTGQWEYSSVICLLRLCFIRALTDQVQVYIQSPDTAQRSNEFYFCALKFFTVLIARYTAVSTCPPRMCRSTLGHTCINELNLIWSAGSAEHVQPPLLLLIYVFRFACYHKGRKFLLGKQIVWQQLEKQTGSRDHLYSILPFVLANR